MKKTKAILMALCAVLLVAASVMGTLAYLTSQDTVTNTFTVGKVAITLDEAKVNLNGQKLDAQGGVYDEEGQVPLAARVQTNEYKLLPGHTYTKDPTVHVTAGSENCWLFVKVENGIADIEDSTNTIAAQMATNGWTSVSGTTNVYGRATTNKAGDNVPVFGTFTISGNVSNEKLAGTPAVTTPEGETTTAAVPGYEGAKVVVTAYAVQADGFASAVEAWTAAGSSFEG